MESKFGVTLKSTGAGSPGNIRKNPPSKRTNPSGLKPANVGNLKAMFDGGEGGKDSGIQKFGTKSGLTSGNRFGQDRLKSDDSKRLDDTDVIGSRLQKGQKSLGSSTKGFEDYKFTIDLDGDEPQVAVAKVFAEDKKTFQSTIEKRVQTVDSESEVIDKDKAKSTLVEQLSLMRTRPGSAGKKDDRPVIKSNSDVPSGDTAGGKTFLQKTNSTQDNKLNIQTKVTNTQPRKFVSTSQSLESSSKSDQDSVISSTRVTKTTGFTNTKTSNVSQTKPIEFGLSFSKKLDTDKDKSTVSHNRQSSSDSSGSFSPRSSVVSNRSQSSYVSRQNSSGSDKNVGSSLTGNISPRSNSPSSTISSISTKFEFNSSSSVNYQRQNSSPRLGRKNVEEVKPEWLDRSKQLVNQFQTKLKKPEQREISRTTVSKSETNTVTQTRLRNVANSDIKDKTKMSSDLGTSYLKKSVGQRHVNKAHSLDNEEVLSRIQKQGPSRKISSDHFQKIKGGFEQIGSGSSDKSVIKTADKPKPKFEIHTTKKLLERKHSFEMQKPDNIPKNVTLKVLRETGKVPKVKDFVQALNAGRQRSASTGSINNKVNMTDDIYEAVDGEEYNDAISQDWPATDSGTDSEAIYEYIAEPDAEGQFDNKIQLSKDGQLRYRVPTRRYGQKRKGVNRPTLSVEEDEGILPDHSSSGFTTEGSSKEGTMESVDDRAGIDADIENDSDSSNSGIYEPINPDFTHVRDDDGDTGNDTPPELPAERIKKKKKDKDGKSAGQKFGSKLKQFYKSKITSNQEPTGIHKVSSAPVVNTTGTTTSSSSAGVFNKIGGKLKLIKRTKSAEPSTLLEEEVVISSSDYEGSDTNENPGLEESEPIMMKPTFADIEYADSSSSCELISNEGTDPQQPAYANDSAKNGELDAPPVPPPLPPRISGNFSSQPDGRTSPPLPPRNRISQNVNLDTVVPISPGLMFDIE
ncbi:hypothetical protein KUTeg_001767 [Tegillarca granosa]|uniref:Uncharacterized protein n=1 Tax=Tegillarca granosa TaxID=220873 RepID=A0ABQ9FSG9_TEGGR|nr:hypothetical protein KUTeg_001767 [Tegillarca granosa]